MMITENWARYVDMLNEAYGTSAVLHDDYLVYDAYVNEENIPIDVTTYIKYMKARLLKDMEEVFHIKLHDTIELENLIMLFNGFTGISELDTPYLRVLNDIPVGNLIEVFLGIVDELTSIDTDKLVFHIDEIGDGFISNYLNLVETTIHENISDEDDEEDTPDDD